MIRNKKISAVVALAHGIGRMAMSIGICVLAGGLSERMGQNKAGLRLGRRTLLGHVRKAASKLRLPVRIIRKDLVARCGPLGGIYTGLKTSRHKAELFLACDMPFVKPELLMELKRRKGPVFVEHGGVAGFPAMIPVTALETVEAAIRAGRFSLQHLARRLKARRLRVSESNAAQLFNVNTPEDWQAAQMRRSELPL